MRFPRSILALALCLAAPLAPGQGLPLEVVNATNQAMSQTPVTFGIPLPELPGLVIDSLENFAIGVKDPGGNPIPHQYKPLARWGGVRSDPSKSLKWVQVTFLADCPANSSVTYRLATGWRPAGQVSLQVLPDRYVIHTRPGNSFTVDRNALTLFRNVTLDGQQIVTQPGGLRMRDGNGNLVTPVVTQCGIEEGGSVRLVVIQKGTLGDLRYTMRYFFHTGQDDVTVDFRLENPGRYGVFYGATSSHRYFQNCDLWLPVTGAGSQVTSPAGTFPLNGQGYEIQQDFTWADPLDALTSFVFQERRGTSVLNSGYRFEGAIDLSGSAGGVSVALDRFWQNFPKAFRVNGNELEVSLFPAWGHGPEYRGQWASPTTASAPVDPQALVDYRFEGGRWKSHRMVFDFHVGSQTPGAVSALAERTNRPLVGRTPGWWVSKTQATGQTFASKRNWNNVALDRLELMFEMLSDDSITTNQAGLGQIGFRKFRERGGTYGGKQMYGWENYGDIVWGEGYGGLHYDLPSSFLMSWVRGGDYESFDTARDMVIHRRDYDQNHSTDTSESWRGAQFYEKGWWHGNYVVGQNSHTWTHGVLLHYVTTGDEASYEAAKETFQFHMRSPPGNWTGLWGARIAGWPMINLLDCYNYLGEVSALQAVDAGLANFVSLEQASGGLGYVTNAGANLQAIPWMQCIVFQAAARYSLQTGDTTYLPLLQRMKSWLQTMIFAPGYPGGTIDQMPWVTQIYHAPTDYREGASVHHTWYVAEAFAYSTLIWGNQSDMDIAYFLYEHNARYHQKSPGQSITFTDSSTWSPIAFRMMQYPGSETKIIGGVLSTAPTYMAMRAWLSGALYEGH